MQETFLKLYRRKVWKAINDERAFLARAAWRLAIDRLPRTSLTPKQQACRHQQLTFVLAKHGFQGRRRLPKQLEFPEPAPLTSEERALLNFASQSKTESSDLEIDTEPIVVKPVQIQPIKTDDSMNQFEEVTSAK